MDPWKIENNSLYGIWLIFECCKNYFDSSYTYAEIILLPIFDFKK